MKMAGELEVEPEDVVELLASYNHPVTDEDLLWVDEPRRDGMYT